MTSPDSPASPLAALVAMAVIAGVVGSLWWNSREDMGDGAMSAGSTARAAAGTAPPSVTPPARRP